MSGKQALGALYRNAAHRSPDEDVLLKIPPDLK